MIFLDEYGTYLRVTDESLNETYTPQWGAYWRVADGGGSIKVYDRWSRLFLEIPVASVTNYSGSDGLGGYTAFTDEEDCKAWLSTYLV